VSLHEYLRFDPDCQQLAEGAFHAAAPLIEDPDPAKTLACLDSWAYELAGRMPLPWNLHEALDALNEFMFRELGFRGNTETYQDPQNAVLPSVIESKQGLPISLSIIWIDLAKRLGLDAVGIALPGHFIVGIRLDTGTLYFDPFYGGRPVGEEEADRLVKESTQGRVALKPEMLVPVPHRAILLRLVRSLYARFTKAQNWDDALWAATHMILLSPGTARPYRDRAFIRIQQGETVEAIRDVEEALRLSPEGNVELESWLEQLGHSLGERNGHDTLS
jgi:regulator of sirC expression with transglutaminase-like and TPR domain